MKISILGFDYDVVFDKKQLERICEEHDFDPDNTWGLHDAENRKIYISPVLNAEQTVQTLLHEILHAIGTITGHRTLSQSTSRNEAIVDAIANGLLTVLKNKDVLEQIKHHLEKEGSE